MNFPKKAFMLLTLLSFLTFYGCNKDEDEMSSDSDFIGVWEITGVSADFSVGTTSLIDYLVNTLQISELEAQAFESLINDGFSEGFDGTVEFKTDNTYSAKFGDDPEETGTWELLEAGKKISLKETGESEATILDVVSISSSNLVVSFEENESEDLDDDGTDEEITIKIEMTLRKL